MRRIAAEDIEEDGLWNDKDDRWPPLPLDEWEDTRATLHMWTQIVGKIRMTLSPPQNHWWHVPLYVCARGLTTSLIPYGPGGFEILFDFVEHKLLIPKSDGSTATLDLAPRSVADFYRELMSTLKSLGIEAQINVKPMEVPDPIPFDQDTVHAAYDADYANRFWRILLNTDCVLREFRGRFVGKSSPIHFFWGSFDLALTRFSGRRAPERPGADLVTREAYSHEVISCGFWPGGGPVKGAAFYCYAAPAPAGLEQMRVQPDAAFYHKELGEFFLMYDDMRRAPLPDSALLDFAQSTYDAAADLAKWDRDALEVKNITK